MPVVAGMAAALWVLLVLAVIGAVLVGTLVLSMIRETLHGLRHQPAVHAWYPDLLDAADQDSTIDDLGEVEDWPGDGWSYRSPPDATAWWWSPGGSAPEMVIDTGHRSGATAVAQKRAATPRPAANNQMWTVHPDHSAHWQDEAGDCPWCRSELV